MNDFASTMEALEHRWMRAWIARDRKDMKTLASRDMIVLFGGDPPTILDRASWLEAVGSRIRCTGYRYGTIYTRKHGKSAVFAAPVALEATMDGKPVLAKAFAISVWQKSAIRRRWQLMERVLSGQCDDETLPVAVRSMQLWR